MFKCPYCFEELLSSTQISRCPHCKQYIIDDILHADYPSLDKKTCFFCGKKINREAKVCRHCHQWIDEIDRAASDIDPEDLL